MSYAIITVGGKQHRVQEGERLLVEHLKLDEGKTFNPRVLLVGGDGKTDLAPSTTVTARVVGHVLGEKVRIGKYANIEAALEYEQANANRKGAIAALEHALAEKEH
jgi:ribosomal protein L21